jgi:hypothetical protein
MATTAPRLDVVIDENGRRNLSPHFFNARLDQAAQQPQPIASCVQHLVEIVCQNLMTPLCHLAAGGQNVFPNTFVHIVNHLYPWIKPSQPIQRFTVVGRRLQNPDFHCALLLSVLIRFLWRFWLDM